MDEEDDIAKALAGSAPTDDDDDDIAKALAASSAEKPSRGTFVPMDQLDNPDRTPVGEQYVPWYMQFEPIRQALRPTQAEQDARVAEEGQQLTERFRNVAEHPWRALGDYALETGAQFLGGAPVEGVAAGLSSTGPKAVRAAVEFAKRHPEATDRLARTGLGAAAGGLTGGPEGALWGAGLTGVAEAVGAGAERAGTRAQAGANRKLARAAYPIDKLDEMRTRGGEAAVAEAGQKIRDVGITKPRGVFDISNSPRRMSQNAVDIMDQSLEQLQQAESSILDAPTGELRQSGPGEFAEVTASESPVDIGIARRQLESEARGAEWRNNPRAAQAYRRASARITKPSGAQPPPEPMESIWPEDGLPFSSEPMMSEVVPEPRTLTKPAQRAARTTGPREEPLDYTPDPSAINLHGEPVPAAPESFTVERSTRPEQPSWPAVGGIEPARVESPFYSVEPHGPVQEPLAGIRDLEAPKTTRAEPGLMLNPAPAPPLEMTGLDDTNLFAREKTAGLSVPDLERYGDVAHDVSMRMTNADMPWGAERPVGPTSPVQPQQPPRGLHQFDQSYYSPELADAPMSSPDVPAGGADLESRAWTPPEPAPVIEQPPRYRPDPNEIRIATEATPEKPAPWAPYGGPLPMDIPPGLDGPASIERSRLPAMSPSFDMTGAGAIDIPPSPRPPQFPYDPSGYTLGKTIDVRRDLGKEIRDWSNPQLNQAPSSQEQQALKKGWQGLSDVLTDAFTKGTPDPAAVAARAQANKTFSTVAEVGPTLAKKANRADFAADRGTARGNETKLGQGLKGWERAKDAVTGINATYNIGTGLKGLGTGADAASDLTRAASSLGWTSQSGSDTRHPQIEQARQEQPDAPWSTVLEKANGKLKEYINEKWYNLMSLIP